MDSWIRSFTGALVAACALSFASTALAQSPTKLTANDGTARDRFGYAVAASSTGQLVAIGAPGDDAKGALSGSVYVFTATASGAWVQAAKLTALDGAANSGFGQQVAISGDNILVGAPSAVANGVQSGAAYVFVKSGSTWTQQAKLVPSDGVVGDSFGSSLALSGDTALIGSPYADVFGADSGAAYVFTRSGSAWSSRKLFPSDGRTGDLFGAAVSVSRDRLAVGAPEDDDNAIASGSVYVYARSGSVFSPQQKLRPSDGANGDLFGNSVAIDGDVVLVGAPDNDDNGIATGSAYVYRNHDGLWTQDQKLLAPSPTAGTYFGNAVAMRGNGAIIGALLSDGAGVDSGAAYVYAGYASGFALVRSLVAQDGAANDNLGASVAIGGTVALAGAEQNDTRGTDAGAAYIVAVPAAASVPAFGAHAALLLAAALVLLAAMARAKADRAA